MGGDVIDSLSIELKSNSTNANRAVDNLISKLGALQTALAGVKGNSGSLTGIGSGIKQLGVGMQSLNGINQSKFNSLANGINKLTAIDTAGLNRSASAIRQVSNAFNGIGQASGNLAPISDLTKSLGKLGGKNVTTAITNIPMLAKAMNGLLTTLSKAPKVSNNVLQMTRALANLASQGQKTSSATKGIANAFKTYDSSVTKSTSITNKLSSAIRKLYQSYFYVIRGISGIKSAVKASMDYIETLNYFDAAFGQVASKAVDDWKEAGYKSAEEYYNSFSKRAKKVTEQMSGYKVSNTGTLDYTGGTTLGIEPNKLMNYQATYGQMASSIGIGAENSLKMSRALTEIGADLASVKNMDFDKTWKDMASGLAGMSRTLDKYGVNIRLVNLQQKLSEIGIEANIQKLNQNEKALLRTIILLDSTKYAWGDLAETINQPANQVRLLKANFQNLTRTIGNLFLPAVAAVLPYINALTIALQRMFNWIGKSLGIDISKLTSGVADSEFDMSELADSTDDVATALDDADKSAKKLKKTTSTIGIDKLNIISKDKDTTDTNANNASSGLTPKGLNQLNDAFEKAYERYQKAWNKAFNSVDNKAQRIADKIVKAFKEGDFEGIGTYIGDNITEGLQSIPWTKIYRVASGFGTGFAQFLNGLISPELFGEVGKTIASSLNTAIYLALGFLTTFDFADFGDSIGAGITNFFETFDFTAFAQVINKWANGILTTVVHGITSINWISVFKGVFDFVKELEPTSIVILLATKRLTSFFKTAGVMKGLGNIFSSSGAKIISVLTKIGPLSKTVYSYMKEFGVKNTVSLGFSEISKKVTALRGSLTGLQKGAIGAVGAFAEFQTVRMVVRDLKTGAGDLTTNIVKLIGVTAAVGTALYLALGPIGLVIGGIAGITGAIIGLQEAEKANEKKIVDSYVTQGEAIDEVRGKAEELRKEFEDDFYTTQQNSIISEEEVDKAKEYFGELQRIVDENGNIKKGYEDRAKILVNYINDNLGTELSIVEGQIDKYKELEGHIDKVIEKKKISNALDTYKGAVDDAKSKMTSAKKDVSDAITAQENAQKEYDRLNGMQKKRQKLTELANQLQQAQFGSMKDGENYSKIKDKFEKARQEFENEFGGSINAYDTAYKESKKQLKAARGVLASSKLNLATLQNTITVYEKMEDAYYSGKFDTAEKMMNNLDSGIMLSNGKNLNALQQNAFKLGENLKQVQKEFEQGISSAEDVQKAKEAYKKQIDEMIKYGDAAFDMSLGSDSWGAKVSYQLFGTFADEIGIGYEKYKPEIKNQVDGVVKDILDVTPQQVMDTTLRSNLAEVGLAVSEAIKSGLSSEKIKEGMKAMMEAGMKGLTGIFSIDAKVLGLDTNGTGGKLAGKIKANNPFNTQKYEIGTNLQFKANGGFVDEGQMFVAREAGPELVGNIGSKTGVLNNDQIVRSVSNGVATAVANVLVGSDFGGSKDDRPIIIQINGREVARAVNEENKRKGSTMLGYGNGY